MHSQQIFSCKEKERKVKQLIEGERNKLLKIEKKKEKDKEKCERDFFRNLLHDLECIDDYLDKLQSTTFVRNSEHSTRDKYFLNKERRERVNEIWKGVNTVHCNSDGFCHVDENYKCNK